jgi:hypothetical protein
MTTAEGDGAPFDGVARAIINGEPPPWLLPVLERFSPFIAGPAATDDVGDEEKKMLDAARYLEKWLPMYVGLEEAGLGFECPECLEMVLQHLPELIEFLESDIEPARKGGRPYDGRRRVCAAVCAEAWRLIHGRIEPHSIYLQRACGAYWRACGHGPIGRLGDEPRNWAATLEWARDNDAGCRELIKQFWTWSSHIKPA